MHTRIRAKIYLHIKKRGEMFLACNSRRSSHYRDPLLRSRSFRSYLIERNKQRCKEARRVIIFNLEAFVSMYKDTPDNYAITAEYRMKANERLNMVIYANIKLGGIAKRLDVLVYCRFYAVRGMIYSGLWGDTEFPSLGVLRQQLKHKSLYDEPFPALARRALDELYSRSKYGGGGGGDGEDESFPQLDFYKIVLERYLEHQNLAELMCAYEHALYKEMRTYRTEILLGEFDSMNQDTNKYAIKHLTSDIERLNHPNTWWFHRFARGFKIV